MNMMVYFQFQVLTFLIPKVETKNGDCVAVNAPGLMAYSSNLTHADLDKVSTRGTHQVYFLKPGWPLSAEEPIKLVRSPPEKKKLQAAQRNVHPPQYHPFKCTEGYLEWYVVT